MANATKFDAFRHLGGGRYVLHAPLIWCIGLAESGWELEIPTGFTFDSSVPPWLRWVVSQHHRPWLLAAAVHDRLLELGFDKAFAAGEWFRAARAMATKDAKRWLVLPAYYGVVLWTVR